MPTRKIADYKPPCRDPDHDPQMHMVLPPGQYEHICRACGRTVTFTVQPVYFGGAP